MGIEMNKLDEEINTLIKQRQQLYHKLDTKEITEEVFNFEILKVSDRLKIINKRKIVLMTTKDENNASETNNSSIQNISSHVSSNVDLKQHPKRKKEIKNKKEKKPTYTYLIIKALKDPRINSADRVIYMVDKWRPGKHKKNIENLLRNILSSLKNHKNPKYKNYYFDKEKYMVYETCQQKL